MIDDVVPDSTQILHQLCLARLSIKVGNTSVEVIGTDGMSHRFVLVAELMTVLIMILTVGDTVADGDEAFGQL